MKEFRDMLQAEFDRLRVVVDESDPLQLKENVRSALGNTKRKLQAEVNRLEELHAEADVMADNWLEDLKSSAYTPGILLIGMLLAFGCGALVQSWLC